MMLENLMHPKPIETIQIVAGAFLLMIVIWQIGALRALKYHQRILELSSAEGAANLFYRKLNAVLSNPEIAQAHKDNLLWLESVLDNREIAVELSSYSTNKFADSVGPLPDRKEFINKQELERVRQQLLGPEIFDLIASTYVTGFLVSLFLWPEAAKIARVATRPTNAMTQRELANVITITRARHPGPVLA